MKIKKSSKDWAESRAAEKAFWQYWEKRWPFTSRNEKVLSLSANFRSTKEAFLAGWEAKDKAQQLLDDMMSDTSD